MSRDQDINQVDVAFVIDTTGSMGGFIEQAKARLVQVLGRLSRAQGLELCFGLVEYRDHPPQDQSFVARSYPFSAEPKQMEKVIGGLTVTGGGDYPEAVLAGLACAWKELKWRRRSARYALLVGDAPPHGVGARGDAFAERCPSGLTVPQVCALAEEARVTLHALTLGADPVLVKSFGALAAGTGGTCAAEAQGPQVIERIEKMLSADFADLDLDRQVLALARQHGLDPETLARLGSWSRAPVSRALARLGQRGFFD